MKNEWTKRIEKLEKDLDESTRKAKAGELYVDMWYELKSIDPPIIITFPENNLDLHNIMEQAKCLRNFLMSKLEQKYFSKGCE